MKKVLIITKSNDNQCIDRVSEAIVRKGGIPIRFNTDTYPLSSAINIEYINNIGVHRMNSYLSKIPTKI